MMVNRKRFVIFAFSTIFLCGLWSASPFSDVTNALKKANDVANSKSAQALKETFKAISDAAEAFTPEQEYYIGRAVCGRILQNYNLCDAPATVKYLNEICQALVVNSENPGAYKGYFVAILDSDEINALSTSGGHILIARGLLNVAESEDAIAAVIAHEIAHIQKKHGIKAIKTSRLNDVLKTSGAAAATIAGEVNPAFADIEKRADVGQLTKVFDSSVDDIVNQMTVSGYSQAQEYEADKEALKLMAGAGYNPKAMNDMLNVLKSKTTSSNSKFGFGKTHPSADKRIKNLNNEFKKYSVADTSGKRTERYNANKL